MDDLIIQKYVAKPLLIDNKKHDLRLYLAITAVDPLIAFLNEEGLARFCTHEYEEPSQANMKNTFMHLTNFSLNKNNVDFKDTEELNEINQANKRTLCSYWKSVHAAGYNVDEVVSFIILDERRNQEPTAAYD